MDFIKKHPMAVAGVCLLALYLYNRSKGSQVRQGNLPASATSSQLPAGPGFVGYIDNGTACQ